MSECIDFIVDFFGNLIDSLNQMIVVNGVSMLGVLAGVIVVAFIIGFIFSR